MKNLIILMVTIMSFNSFAKIKVPVTTTSTAVDQIAKYFGESSYYHLKTNKLDGMLKEYLWDSYEDEDMLKNVKVALDQETIQTDNNTVGTLKSDAVLDTLTEALKEWIYISKNEAETVKGDTLVRATEIIAYNLKIIANEGAIFGFDGNHFNTCGAPANFLLVIDIKNSNIFGINLNPCYDK